MNKIYLDKEYNIFINKIKKNINFTFLKYDINDYFIINNHHKDIFHNDILEKILLQIMRLSDNKIYYGIPSPCYNRYLYYWYATRIISKQITFNNLFTNNLLNELKKINKNIIIITNNNNINKFNGLNILEYYFIEKDYNKFLKNSSNTFFENLTKKWGNKNNILYLIDAGFLSKIIIYKLYKNNSNNCYIDISTVFNNKNIYLKNKINNNPIVKDNNCWMFEPLSTNFEVSIILTLFKKPDTLQKQIEAILNQSLKPKEILLFQDGIIEPYKICIDQKILKLLKKYQISETNKGVWERFKFAQEASSKYICLFDDDTIPGNRWLENCHYNMMFNEGIYGTVGIILKNYKDYPYKDYFRIGWVQPFSKAVKVDFVGHSWFFKRSYLKYMFDNTEKYQAYKYVAEDMCLSFKCKQHGILTYVPPHPYGKMELWGSQKEFASKYGKSAVAVSMNSNNFFNMNKALIELKNDGWKFLYQEDNKYIKKILYQVKSEEQKFEKGNNILYLKYKILEFFNKLFS